MSLQRQMLLTFDPKVGPRFQADIKNAHGILVDEINRKPDKPLSIALLALTVSNPPTQAQVQAVADKLDEVIAALQA